MKRYRIILLGILVGGFLMIPSNAVAHASHAGAHSPFDAPKGKKSLHCQLLNHHHAGLPFCPHTMRDLNTQPQFKADCGDSPSGTPVQIQWSKILMLFPSVEKTSSDVKKHFFEPTRFHLPSPFHDRLEKPPQHS
jgi:hypothetical protein